MSLTATEQDELDALELEELEAEEAALSKPANEPKEGKQFSMMDTDIPVPIGGGVVSINPKRALHTAKNLGLEGGLATAGQALGAPFEAVGGMHIGGALGGGIGNALAQATTPGKKFSGGEVLAAMASGAIPGASLAKAGAKEVAKQGAKYAASNLAGMALQTGVDEGRLPTAGEAVMATAGGAAGAPISKFLDRGIRAEVARVARTQDSVRRETLNAGRGLGLVVPPPAVAPGPVNDTLTSLAGKAAAAQESTLRNQPKINAAIRSEIGLPADAPLSPIAINTARVPHELVYKKIASTSPEAANLLEQFKQAQADTNELYAAYRNSAIKDPATLKAAKAREVEADTFKRGLGQVIGKDLLAEFDSARVSLAKIGQVDRATRLGDGNVDAKVFGDALEHGEKLTGNLLKIGRFQSAFGRYVREASKTPPSGVDYLKLLAKGGVAAGAAASGNLPMAVAGPLAMMGAERGARSLVLSGPYQRLLANPNYGAALEDVPAAVGRIGAESASRNVDLDEPLSDEEYRRYEELKAKLRGARE